MSLFGRRVSLFPLSSFVSSFVLFVVIVFIGVCVVFLCGVCVLVMCDCSLCFSFLFRLSL